MRESIQSVTFREIERAAVNGIATRIIMMMLLEISESTRGAVPIFEINSWKRVSRSL